jgi:hypothetical protein
VPLADGGVVAFSSRGGEPNAETLGSDRRKQTSNIQLSFSFWRQPCGEDATER